MKETLTAVIVSHSLSTRPHCPWQCLGAQLGLGAPKAYLFGIYKGHRPPQAPFGAQEGPPKPPMAWCVSWEAPPKIFVDCVDHFMLEMF